MAFEPTDEQVYTVEIMAARDEPLDVIADTVGVTVADLERPGVLADAVKYGPARVRTRLFEATYRQGLAGNVNAAKLALDMVGGDPKKAGAAMKKAEKAAANRPDIYQPRKVKGFGVVDGGGAGSKAG